MKGLPQSMVHGEMIDVPQCHAPWVPAAQHYQLLAEQEIFGFQPRSPPKSRPQSQQQVKKKHDHRPLHYHTLARPSSPDKVFGRHNSCDAGLRGL
jgi:hypothetical protein